MAPVQYNTIQYNRPSYLVYAKIPDLPLWYSELQILAIINDWDSVTRPNNSTVWAAASSASRLGKASSAGVALLRSTVDRTPVDASRRRCSLVPSVDVIPSFLWRSRLSYWRWISSTSLNWARLHDTTDAFIRRMLSVNLASFATPVKPPAQLDGHPFWRCISSLPASRPTIVFMHCRVHSSHLVL